VSDPKGPLAGSLDQLARVEPKRLAGRVTELCGLVVRASVPQVRTGDLVRILTPHGPLEAEVVGFRDDEAVLMPLGEPRGLGPRCEVEPLGRPLTIRCGETLLGRVLDGLGRPVDGRPPPDPTTLEEWDVDRPAPDPLRRERITRPLGLGIRAIDGLLTVGEGQRVGLFAGSGVGKSTLLGQIAQNTAAEVNVICLCGERGREVREFLEESLGPGGLARSVIVCATSDAPSLVRLKSAYVATAIAEWFRDRGHKVLFLLDSVTRLARALREVGLAAGEPPARQGYPPSVFAALPRLLERTGNGATGSITAIYTVLVAGGDMEEPIADEVRGILDGHIVLSRPLGARGHWPAIDVLESVSRVMGAVTDEDHRRAASRLKALLAAYEQKRDLILLGAYRPGADAATDEAIARHPDIEAFLRQRQDERPPLEATRARLCALFAP
jgi:type III secretion protein N (ATPase)